MRALSFLPALVLTLSGPVLWAEAPTSSLRPLARAEVADPAVAEPAPPVAEAGEAAATAAAPPQALAFGPSLRPQPRPETLARKAPAPARKAAIIAPPPPAPRAAKGGLCGDPALQGSVVGRIGSGSGQGCGADDAVKLTSVSGIRLSSPATVDCATAKAMKNWVNNGLLPAVGNAGGGVDSIRIMASYACRTRNNQKGARISEHGRGRAVDIGGFTLKNGQTISVLTDWGKGSHGKALRQMHRAACGPFGTVLGPEANRFHRDHFHFDTVRYRNGTYCK